MRTPVLGLGPLRGDGVVYPHLGAHQSAQGWPLSRVVFEAWVGSWTVQRWLTNHHDVRMTGTMQGWALFTRGVDPMMCRYREEGTFFPKVGEQVVVCRDLIYCYDRQQAWVCCYAAGSGAAKSLLHVLQFNTCLAGVGATGLADVRRCGAQHVHRCGRDVYNVSYVVSQDSVPVREMQIVYRVTGPEKDYRSTTCYTRVSAAAP